MTGTDKPGDGPAMTPDGHVPMQARHAVAQRAPEAVVEAPRPGRPARAHSGFGEALNRIMERRGIRATQLARTLGVSPSYLSALVTGSKPVSPDRVEDIAENLGADPDERTRLHRAAARDMGFRLDLPEDF